MTPNSHEFRDRMGMKGQTSMYTPGLKVLAATHHRVERRLALPGELAVHVGQTVAAQDIVARMWMPGRVLPVNIARELGVSAGTLKRYLKVVPGAQVAAGDLVAANRGWWGLISRESRSPVAGTFESVSQLTGQAIYRGIPQPVELCAYLPGEVTAVFPNEGVAIEANVALVQGIFGIGGEAFGTIEPLVADPNAEISEAAIEPRHQGAVLIGGGLLRKSVIDRAIACGVSAIVTGGIDDEDLKELLGYDLGVAITGTERLGLTIVITEGFGSIGMARRTFDLFCSLAGQFASVNGATQIRAGVLRPEVVVARTKAVSRPVNGESQAGQLRIGAPVRLIRDPYFGLLGSVSELPHAPQQLPSESFARVLKVRLESGSELVVPRANVELIEVV